MHSSSSGSTIGISVVIPCRNEEAHIENCLRSVLQQEPPEGGFEVLVVDGRSEDRTREIIERLAADDPRLRLVDNPARITPAAFNQGIRESRGELIAIMGAHNTYERDYLKQAQAVSRETGADNVGGSMHCVGHGYLQEAIAASHHSPFAVGGARWHDPNYEGPADTVFGGIYRRETFDRIGLFDEELVRNQDDELNLRLLRSGGRIWHSPRIGSRYTPRDTLGKLFNQYYQYGYWKVAVIRKHRLPASIRHLVPATFVATLGLSTLAALAGLLLSDRLLTVLAGGVSLTLFVSWTLGAMLAALATARQSRWHYAVILPTIFCCYHFGYGLGFVHGIIDFLLLRRGGRLNRINR